MNIRTEDFVLEIGSGHNPKARSDVLCDKFIADDEQRGGGIVTDRPIVEADGQYLPFRDRAFDYVICAHVLEHVEDPSQLITELTRVATRGYIETPSEIGEQIYGWPYHNWVINRVDERLMLRKNRKNAPFGQLFHQLAATDKQWQRFHLSHHHLFLVQYEWENEIDYEILPDQQPAIDLTCPMTLERLITAADDTPGQPAWLLRLKNAIPRSIVSQAKSLLQRPGRHRREQRTLKDILVCPTCKSEMRWEPESLHCDPCSQRYPIVDGIPRFICR